MTMEKLTTWVLAVGAALVLAGGCMSGPSDIESAQLVAEDMAAAELAAQRFERDLRECKRRVGPAADLIQIGGTEHYVCRDVAIEPTPARVMHRYALLGGGK